MWIEGAREVFQWVGVHCILSVVRHKDDFNGRGRDTKNKLSVPIAIKTILRAKAHQSIRL